LRPLIDGSPRALEYYLGKERHLDMPIETVSYTPAQIKHVVNEAVVHGVWNGRTHIAEQMVKLLGNRI
jgi:hypothetical protein